MRTRTRTIGWAAVGTLALGLLVMLAPARSAAAADHTCAGQQATLVGNGTWDDEIVGSDGADVIVSNAARFVDGGDGDDLICLTGRVSDRRNIKVFDGDGDDVVRNETTFVGDAAPYGQPVLAYLFGGDDTFVGSDQPEFVAAYTGTDTIDTGGGDDVVFAGKPPVDRTGLDGPLDGRIDLGDDGGILYVGELVQPTTELEGGAGPSQLSIVESVPGETGWTIDVGLGRAHQAGQARYTFTGFTTFSLIGKGVEHFIGTDGPEAVYADSLGLGDLRGGDDAVGVRALGSVRLGEGDDSVRYETFAAPPSPDELDGGPGTDHLWPFTEDRLELDLARQEVRSTSQVGAFSGFETFHATARGVALIGSEGADQVDLEGCRVSGSSAGGDDVVLAYPPDPDDGWPRCPARSAPHFSLAAGPGDDVVRSFFPRGTIAGDDGDDRLTGAGTLAGGKGDDRVYLNGRASRATGGRGHDRLFGGGHADVLVGNAGRDVARGGGGRDRCVAEVRRSCER